MASRPSGASRQPARKPKTELAAPIEGRTEAESAPPARFDRQPAGFPLRRGLRLQHCPLPVPVREDCGPPRRGRASRPTSRPTTRVPAPCYHSVALSGHSVGAWRSLVARIVRDDEVGGSNPLAPTTYGYSQLSRQHRREAMTDRVRAERDGRLPHPQDLDAVEQGRGQIEVTFSYNPESACSESAVLLVFRSAVVCSTPRRQRYILATPFS